MRNLRTGDIVTHPLQHIDDVRMKFLPRDQYGIIPAMSETVSIEFTANEIRQLQIAIDMLSEAVQAERHEPLATAESAKKKLAEGMKRVAVITTEPKS